MFKFTLVFVKKSNISIKAIQFLSSRNIKNINYVDYNTIKNTKLEDQLLPDKVKTIPVLLIFKSEKLVKYIEGKNILITLPKIFPSNNDRVKRDKKYYENLSKKINSGKGQDYVLDVIGNINNKKEPLQTQTTNTTMKLASLIPKNSKGQYTQMH